MATGLEELVGTQPEEFFDGGCAVCGALDDRPVGGDGNIVTLGEDDFGAVGDGLFGIFEGGGAK